MRSQTPEPQEPRDAEIELDDDALELAAGGSSESERVNSTDVYASTFIPFDSSF